MADPTVTFNLADDPWIPVAGPHGSERVSLRQALTEPERWTTLETGEIDEFFGLLRLLTTVLNRAFGGPRNPDEWARIAYEDGYDVAAVDAYLDAWKHRFDLFDSERPFLQFPELAGQKVTGPAALLPSLASGNSITLFSHAAERDGLSLRPADAARALVHVVVNGRGALKGGEYGVHGARVAVLGDSLRATLIENLPPDAGDRGMPVWEQPAPRRLGDGSSKDPLPCTGLHDLATWQWRAVLLSPPDDGVVTACVFQPGPKVAGEEPLDPSRWYDMKSEKDLAKDPGGRAWKDHRLRPDRDVWRDADALVAALTAKDRPSVLSWNADVREDEAFDVVVGGPIAELKGSWMVTGVRAARLPVPRALLTDATLIARVATMVEAAEDTATRLRNANNVLAEEMVRYSRDERPSFVRAKRLARALTPAPRYWASLASRFPAHLAAIDDDEALPTWRREIGAEALRALDESISGVAMTPRGVRAAASARHRFLAPERNQKSEAKQAMTVEAAG